MCNSQQPTAITQINSSVSHTHTGPSNMHSDSTTQSSKSLLKRGSYTQSQATHEHEQSYST